MSRRKEIALVAVGVLAGLAVSAPAAAAGLMANPSGQTFYVNEQKVSLEAYEINGSNYVKLRDVGQAVGFGVSYDAASNSVAIRPDQPFYINHAGNPVIVFEKYEIAPGYMGAPEFEVRAQ